MQRGGAHAADELAPRRPAVAGQPVEHSAVQEHDGELSSYSGVAADDREPSRSGAPRAADVRPEDSIVVREPPPFEVVAGSLTARTASIAHARYGDELHVVRNRQTQLPVPILIRAHPGPIAVTAQRLLEEADARHR